MAHQDSGVGAGGLLVAFIAGAVTGAAVALLLAPAAGEETREYLGDRAREGRDRAAEAARQGRELLNRQRDTLASAVDRGREAYQAARDAAASREQDA
ncbi:MAG: YtxH domain-containing protein [Vicinamibacterales bacterium]